MSLNSRLSLDVLESELSNTIEQDSRYWRENNAKFRAVAQNATYEQFEEIVKASHLKPIEKQDKTQYGKIKSTIWNSIANATSRKPANMECNKQNAVEAGEDCINNLNPQTFDEFYESWRRTELPERIKFLQNIGSPSLQKIFSIEVPSELIVDFIYTFISFGPSVSDLVTVVNTLEILTKSKRFSLNVQFLSKAEKEAAGQLVEKLRAGLTDRQQDLAELGVTEWHIENISRNFAF